MKEWKKIMPRLTILCGLPASGKSTYVKKMQNEGYKFTLISFDELHRMLFGEYRLQEFPMVVDVSHNIFDKAVFYGHNIMIDNTNLRGFYINRWIEYLGGYTDDYEVEIIPFKVSLHECFYRNLHRDRNNMNVPQNVILKMASSSDLDWMKKMWQEEKDYIASHYKNYGLTLEDIERYVK